MRPRHLLLLLILACHHGRIAAQEPQGIPAPSILSVGMTVSDLDRSLDFFTKVLDFSIVHQGRRGENEAARTALLQLGDERLELIEYVSPGRPIPRDSASNDRWFQHVAIIVRDMDAAYARLRQTRIRHVSPSPQRLPDWNKDAGGIRAFYFLDPDGHPLEILHFPPGKGDPKWHRSTQNLFLGIDHTAIVVADTRASLKFYRDTLGLRIVGTSNNYGLEQERLNNVVGAGLQITTLRGASGPGIELLEYTQPKNGRAIPADTRPNDLWHWFVRIDTDERDSVRVACPAPASRLTSDPDGHRLLVRASESTSR
jgi:catechol 2,3-dioxygenase-like lactoylglutathione lyase family enzyme